MGNWFGLPRCGSLQINLVVLEYYERCNNISVAQFQTTRTHGKQYCHKIPSHGQLASVGDEQL